MSVCDEVLLILVGTNPSVTSSASTSILAKEVIQRAMADKVEKLVLFVKCKRCGGDDKPRLEIHVLESGKGHGEFRCQHCQAFNEVTLSAKELEDARIRRQKAVLRNASMASEMEDLKDEDFDLQLVAPVRKSYQIHYRCSKCNEPSSPIVQLVRAFAETLEF
jgi:hypothetical protein